MAPGQTKGGYTTFQSTTGLVEKYKSYSLNAKAVALGFLLVAVGAFVGLKGSQAWSKPQQSIVTVAVAGIGDVVLGSTGAGACDNGGTVITEASMCIAALSSLGIPNVSVQDGDICYKDASGNGYANGRNGAGAQFVCSDETLCPAITAIASGTTAGADCSGDTASSLLGTQEEEECSGSSGYRVFQTFDVSGSMDNEMLENSLDAAHDMLKEFLEKSTDGVLTAGWSQWSTEKPITTVTMRTVDSIAALEENFPSALCARNQINDPSCTSREAEDDIGWSTFYSTAILSCITNILEHTEIYGDGGDLESTICVVFTDGETEDDIISYPPSAVCDCAPTWEYSWGGNSYNCDDDGGCCNPDTDPYMDWCVPADTSNCINYDGFAYCYPDTKKSEPDYNFPYHGLTAVQNLLCASKNIAPCNLDTITTYLKEDMGVTLINLMVGTAFVDSVLERMYELSSCNGYDTDCAYAGAYSDFESLDSKMEKIVCNTMKSLEEVLDPTCTFECADGFQLVGNSTITCEGGAWPAHPVCEANSCITAPSAPTHGAIAFSAADNHGSVATFACNAGFTQSGDTTVTCDATTDGTAWPTASNTPTCTANSCITAPSAPTHGTVAFSAADNSGSVATFACNAGFTQSGDTTVTCDNTVWPTAANTPTCTDGNLFCPALEIHAQGEGCKQVGKCATGICGCSKVWRWSNEGGSDDYDVIEVHPEWQQKQLNCESPPCIARGMVVARYNTSFGSYNSATFVDSINIGRTDIPVEFPKLVERTEDGWIIAVATIDEPFEYWRRQATVTNNSWIMSSALESVGMADFPEITETDYGGSMAGVGVVGCSGDANGCPSFTGYTKKGRYAEVALYTASIAGYCRKPCGGTHSADGDCPQTRDGGTCETSCPYGMVDGSQKVTCNDGSWTEALVDCSEVVCPEGSSGSNVRLGCTCNLGFSGRIDKSAGGYVGSCEPLACPENSQGPDGVSCTCNDGFVGAIDLGVGGFSGECYNDCDEPGICGHGTCVVQVRTGDKAGYTCECDAGFFQMPEDETCDQVAQCPENSYGISVVDGCVCNDGFSSGEDAIIASAEAPYYENVCHPVECPENSNGEDVVSGCTCNEGYAGIIQPASGGYSGACVAFKCTDVPNAHGIDVSSGCTCNTGFAGTVTAAVHEVTPYVSTCAEIICPSNSYGHSVSTGCTCNPGWDGSIQAVVGSAGYTGECTDINECMVPTEPCDFQEDGARASCDNLENNFYCHCDANHYGTTCNNTHADCDEPDICGHGTCVEQVRTGDKAAYTCECDAGFFQMPEDKTCDQVAQCPENSYGNSVVDGCVCNDGFSSGKDVVGTTTGVISATTEAPYYENMCHPNPCMVDPVVEFMVADKGKGQGKGKEQGKGNGSRQQSEKRSCENTFSGASCDVTCEYGFHTYVAATCMEGQWVSSPNCHVTNSGGALDYCNLYPDLMATFCDGGMCSTGKQAGLCQHHFNAQGMVEGRDENGLRTKGLPWGMPELMHPCGSDPLIANLDGKASLCEGTASGTNCEITCEGGHMPTPNKQALSARNIKSLDRSQITCIGDSWENNAADVRTCEPVACPPWVATDNWANGLTLESSGAFLLDTDACTCHARLHGETIATSTPPFFALTCEPNNCVIPQIDEGRLGNKAPSIAAWAGDGCSNAAEGIAHGVVCDITPSFGWTCVSPGRCVAEQFENTAKCTPNNCQASEIPPAPVKQGTYGEGIESWNLKACAGGTVDHETVCEITPEFGYNCVSPGECYAQAFDQTPTCTAYQCVRPTTKERTTKHGQIWNRNDAYVFNEIDLRAADRYWNVTVECAPGFVGTPVVGVCTDGKDSAYSVSGCNIDTDLDGVSDDNEDCETDPNKISCGLCGCNKVDYDETTGAANCASPFGIGWAGAGDSQFYTIDVKEWDAKGLSSGHDFTAPAGKCDSLSLKNWMEEGIYGDLDKNYAFGQAKGTGTLTTASFIITKSTLAFQAGFGAVGTTVKLLTMGGDGTYRIRKELAPIGPLLEHFWDVSGMFQEQAILRIENLAVGERVTVNNVRLFDSVQGCIPDCMMIEPQNNITTNLLIMGTIYTPVNQRTSYTDKTAAMYCADSETGLVSAGATPGGAFIEAFPEGIEYDHLDLDNLPNCLMVRQLNSDTFEVAVETGTQRFSYSKLYTPEGIESDSLHCVYPTKHPRCIDYWGILTGMRQADMWCSEVEPSMVCMETALQSQCPSEGDVLCGATKKQRDIFECCDKNGNRLSGCLSHSRRLGATIRVSPEVVLDMDTAEACARACLKSPDNIECVAWRLNDFDDSCRLAQECYPKGFAEIKALNLLNNRWSLLTPDTNPYAGKTVRKEVAALKDE